MARVVFGENVLINSTVTGRMSNRNKSKHAEKDVPQKLDGRKLEAIRGKLFCYYIIRITPREVYCNNV